MYMYSVLEHVYTLCSYTCTCTCMYCHKMKPHLSPNLQIKDCQLNCMVNRDLTRRVKQCSGVAWAQKAVQSDMTVVHRLIQLLDEKNKLWEHAQVQPATGEGTETEEKEVHVCLLLFSIVCMQLVLAKFINISNQPFCGAFQSSNLIYG